MGEYKCLITCSGIGQRLGELTKYTNKSLVKVGRKPSISYIIEKYSEDIEIVITLGYFGNQIKEFLELAYPTRKFNFIIVDKYEGIGSSLLYSMLCAKEELQCPFIFHACDSIILDEIILEPNYNWLGGFNKINSSQYRTFNIENDKVKKINEKGEGNYDFEYIGLCGIKDYVYFWENAERIYKENFDESSLSDCHVIKYMLKEREFKFTVFSSWLDIGNMASLQQARESIYDKFQILDKLDESIFIFDDSVIKFFYDTNIVKNRITRGNLLYPTTPKITGIGNNFYKYDYVSGKLFSKSVNEYKFNIFLQWANDVVWNEKIVDNFKSSCYDFYITKTKNRVNKFLKENNIQDKENYINGILVKPIELLLEDVLKYNICDGIPVKFHGDFILDNIIETENGFTLLDWRQDFAGRTDCGDLYYDLSKLNHNLTVNHDIINKNLYEIKINKDESIEVDILINSKLVECSKILKNFIIKFGYNYEKVQIITGLIWINMAPLHHHPFDQFLFYFGKYNLNKALKVINE